VVVRRVADEDEWRAAVLVLGVDGPASVAALRERFACSGAALLVAHQGPIAIGVVGVVPAGALAAELSPFIVRPIARATGVSRLLLAAAIVQATDLGHRSVHLAVASAPSDLRDGLPGVALTGVDRGDDGLDSACGGTDAVTAHLVQWVLAAPSPPARARGAMTASGVRW
jgi:hypothetical protein